MAYNLVTFQTEVEESSKVESVQYIGYYEDYDLDGNGRLAGWNYTIDNGDWGHIIGRQNMAPYAQTWNNNWVPEQDGPIRVIAKINSVGGLSFLTAPVEFNRLKQRNSRVKMYEAKEVEEYFGSRGRQRKECKITINDDLTGAISAYLILSSWSGEAEDGARHMVGINGKMLAESPGKLHDWAFLRIPVPLEYLKSGDNIFFVYSETDEHMFEVNFPGPAILIRHNPGTSDSK